MIKFDLIKSEEEKKEEGGQVLRISFSTLMISGAPDPLLFKAVTCLVAESAKFDECGVVWMKA